MPEKEPSRLPDTLGKKSGGFHEPKHTFDMLEKGEKRREKERESEKKLKDKES